MDRQELEQRLRTRRPGDAPYRRGAPAGESGFDRFEPEPEDSLARREERSRSVRNVDNFSERSTASVRSVAKPVESEPSAEGWRAAEQQRPGPEAAQRVAAPPPFEPPAEDELVPEPGRDEADVDEAPYAEDASYDYGTDYEYDYGARPYAAERRSSGGPWLILGILALGLVALLGGVLLAGVLGGGPGVARQTATPSAGAATASPSVTQQATATPEATTEPTPSQPGVFADGFTADVQPCASSKMDPESGCAEDASTTGASSIWAWAGFKRGTSDDVVSITLIEKKSHDKLSEASRDLSEIGCGERCDGYLSFRFSGLAPGDYVLRIDRNGDFAAEAPFTVTG